MVKSEIKLEDSTLPFWWGTYSLYLFCRAIKADTVNEAMNMLNETVTNIKDLKIDQLQVIFGLFKAGFESAKTEIDDTEIWELTLNPEALKQVLNIIS
jgi:hypothetical protein